MEKTMKPPALLDKFNLYPALPDQFPVFRQLGYFQWV